MLAQKAANIITPEGYAYPNEIYDLLKEVREKEPVIWVEPEGYRPLWLITRAEHVKFVETNAEQFLAKPRTHVATIAEEQTNLEIYGSTVPPMETLPGSDGIRHRKLRMLSQGWFMPAQLKQKIPMIDAIAKQFVERMVSQQPECDFANDIAFWYPLRVINSILGLPEEYDEPFFKLAQKSFAITDDELHGADVPIGERMSNSLEGFFQIFKPLIEEKRENPQDDMISLLVTAELDGKPLNEQELLGYLIVAATAGHDTTSATTAGGLLALIEHPDQMQMLKDNPGLLPNAIEECLRWVAPVKHFVRTATKDVEIGGKLIKEGDSVAVMFASTCRDEALFENPNQFRIDRKPNNHLAFGIGPHLCLGMHLARMEISAFYRELLPRLDSIELASEPTYLKSNVVSGIKTMPIKFSMR